MSEISAADRLYSLGAPVWKIEIDNKTFDVHLRMVIKEYSSFINSWLIEQQFPFMQGLNIDSADITLALTTKTMDFEASFAASYSKQFGVGNTKFSTWELKKDYITISSNTQVYFIPEGREVNEVLWMTPPNVADMGGVNDGFWNFGPTGWIVGGFNMQALLPSYNLMLFAQDRQQKRKLLQSELTYRIAPGPNKTKMLFLYPMPGSHDEMSSRFGRHYEGSRVYYFYYDTNSKGRKKCLEQNDDIIKTPNDIPIGKIKYSQMNDVSKLRIRELMVVKLLEYLAINRGKFSGELPGVNDKTIKMDYEFLQNRADAEKERIYELIGNTLKKLSYGDMMEERARIAENLHTVLNYQAPLTQFLIT